MQANTLKAQFFAGLLLFALSFAPAAAMGADLVWAAGNQGRVARSDDGGASWTLMDTGAPQVWSGIDFVVDEGTGDELVWVVGQNGVIYHSSDGGVGWAQQQGPVSNVPLDAVDFFDEEHGIAVGANYTSVTTNGGANWTNLFTVASFGGRDVVMLSATEAYAVRGKDAYFTSDGGFSWTQASNSSNSNLLIGLSMIDECDGWAVGRAGHMLRLQETSPPPNQVCSWATVQSPAFGPNSNHFPDLSDVFFLDSDRGWAIGGIFPGEGFLMRTLDGGATWTSLEGSFEIFTTPPMPPGNGLGFNGLGILEQGAATHGVIAGGGSSPNPPQLLYHTSDADGGGFWACVECPLDPDPSFEMFGIAVSQAAANEPPVADAGMGDTVHPGTLATVDGSGSNDPDGNTPLGYEWTFASVPPASALIDGDIANANAVLADFTPDVLGDYVVRLIVSDSLGLASGPDTVTISTFNTAPQADAGEDIAVVAIGSAVQLDGTGSDDLDGDAFSYAWTLTQKPGTSAAMLDDASSATPSFTADVRDPLVPYVAELVVTDIFGTGSPNPADADGTVNVSFDNLPPVADIAGPGTASVGDSLTLDGTGSTDPNLDALSFAWSLDDQPPGSSVGLTGAASSAAGLVPDIEGSYTVSLVVNDGDLDSSPATHIVIATSLVDEALELVEDADDFVSAIPRGDLTNKNSGKTLKNKLGSVADKINEGQFVDALGKVENDLVKKTDGCALRSSADTGGNSGFTKDWITLCGPGGQEEVYQALVDLAERLRELIDQQCPCFARADLADLQPTQCESQVRTVDPAFERSFIRGSLPGGTYLFAESSFNLDSNFNYVIGAHSTCQLCAHPSSPIECTPPGPDVSISFGDVQEYFACQQIVLERATATATPCPFFDVTP